MVSLAGGLPAAELYPHEAIRAATDRALSRWGTQALEYGPVEGLPALRATLAARLSARTGATFTADNVLITTGAMQGLDLIGKMLIDSGDLVVTQFPTYLGALDAWRARQPRYLPLQWEPDHPAADAALQAAKFIYAVPNFSNPTGVLVPLPLREQLLQRCARTHTWLLEDDPYCELQYEGAAVPSILSLDANQRARGRYDGPVIYLGTLSKSIVPGLRVGWAVADARVVQTLARAKMSTDLSGCMFTQAVALQLMEEDIESRLKSTIIDLYRQRRDVLCAQAAAMLSDWFEWQIPPGGMFVWMRAKDPRIDTNKLYQFALEEKVAFVPSSVFDYDGALKSAMRVNFTRAAPALIEEGVRRLARATRRYLAALA